MSIIQTHISDCKVFYPEIFSDSRGHFTEIYNQSKMNILSLQINYSKSKYGVFRGIHRTPYSKLVTCVSGSIYDICVDLRSDSITYKKYFGIRLDSKVLNTIYIPPYCGHGFLALEDSMVIYSQADVYNKSLDETYCYKDFNIDMPFDPIILSDKDMGICI